MTNIKNRLLSGLLTFVLMLSLVPVTVQAKEQGKSGYFDEVVFEQTSSDMADKGLTLLDTLNSENEKLRQEYWHYSGGYWKFGANADLGIEGTYVYDSDFKESSLEGGVADPNKVFIVNGQPYPITVKAGSKTAKSLDAGEKLVVNIKPANEGVKLDNLFGDKAQITSVKKQANGDYIIVLTVDLKINYYEDEDLSFYKHYGLNLNSYVPIIVDGYGYNMFSMFRYADEGVKAELAGEGRLWVDIHDKFSIKNMPEGFIHPTMIRPYDAVDRQGVHTGKVNDGGLLYKDTPILDSKGKNTGKTVSKKVGFFWRDSFDTEKKLVDTPTVTIGDDTMSSGGAQGICLEYPVLLEVYAKPQVKVVASYVELTDLTEVGSSDVYIAQYKTLCESELLSVPVHDNIVSIPLGTVMT